MTACLANLLTPDNPAFKHLSDAFESQNQGSPTLLLILLGIAVLAGVATVYWRQVQQQRQQPGPRRLLKVLADEIGLSPQHRRLVSRLAWSAGWEPASALLSPGLLAQLLEESRRKGFQLTREQDRRMGEIFDIVNAAGNEPDADGQE